MSRRYPKVKPRVALTKPQSDDDFLAQAQTCYFPKVNGRKENYSDYNFAGTPKAVTSEPFFVPCMTPSGWVKLVYFLNEILTNQG